MKKQIFYSFQVYSHEEPLHQIITSTFDYQTKTWKFKWLETNEHNPNVTLFELL